MARKPVQINKSSQESQSGDGEKKGGDKRKQERGIKYKESEHYQKGTHQEEEERRCGRNETA